MPMRNDAVRGHVDVDWILHDTPKRVTDGVASLNTALNADTERALCIDAEWDSHDKEKLPLSLLQASVGDGIVHLFDAMKVDGVERYGSPHLADLMRDERVVVVVHAGKKDAEVLRKRAPAVELSRVFDTQVAHAMLGGEAQMGLGAVLKHWLDISLSGKEDGRQYMRRKNFWTKRPIPQPMLEYAAGDVRHLPALYKKQREQAERQSKLDEIFRLSAQSAGQKKQKRNAEPAALAFLGYVDAHPAERLRCEDIDGYKATFREWKQRETAAGRAHRGNSYEIFAKLQILKLAMRQGPAVIFRQTPQPLTDAGVGSSIHGVNALDVGGNGGRGGRGSRGGRGGRGGSDSGGRGGRGGGSGGRVTMAELQQVVERVTANRGKIEADKCGVSVTQVQFEPSLVREGETTRCTLQVTNGGADAVEVRRATLLKQQPQFVLLAASVEGSTLSPGQSLNLVIRCTPTMPGMSHNTLMLTFDSFSIGRFLEVRCGDLDLLDDLKPIAPFVRRKKKAPRHQMEPMIAPPAPEEDRQPPEFLRLRKHRVPREWKLELLRPLAESEAGRILEDGAEAMVFAPAAEAMRAHRQHLQRLLWTEELQLEADLSDFDLVGDRAAPDLGPRGGGLLALHVRGLAEKRPSVLRGDIVKVNRIGERPGKWGGRAERIEMQDALLRFNHKFVNSYIPRTKVEVRFVLGRRPLRLFHQGVVMAAELPIQLLFPPDDLRSLPECPSRVARPVHVFNPNVGANEQQLRAVERIVAGAARQVPYILFGPPGTGKTTTVVEAILQCRRCCTGNAGAFRVLACAPTNTAADLICERLAKVVADRGQMMRIMAFSRSEDDVPEAVRKYSKWSPSLQEVVGMQVVVSTLTTAGSLVNLGVDRGHFDLIVLDEAGQALEPEALVPIGALHAPGTQLLLAGDPQQLGPVIHSHLASEHGLSVSLLERLTQRRLYGRDHEGSYQPLVLTKLVRNYRSHAALLKLPNQLFYDNELVACAHPELRDHCCEWDRLPTPGCPLLFDGIVGKDEREGSSPSWFNCDECGRVLEYTKDLLAVRGKTIKPWQIGVITPYNKQAQKLKRLLIGAGIDCSATGIKVGSTEMFQGQERRVIIISTVRSSEEYINFDLKHHLGFLHNPKRFNVAITRACALLIIVGNPIVLLSDRYWGALVRRAVELNAYRGVELPPRPWQFETQRGVGGHPEGPGQSDEDEDDRSAAGDAMQSLAADLSDLMLSPSDRVQQEGLEMPTFD